MVGIGGAAHHPRGGAGVRHPHLPHTSAAAAALEEARSLAQDKGTTRHYYTTL